LWVLNSDLSLQQVRKVRTHSGEIQWLILFEVGDAEPSSEVEVLGRREHGLGQLEKKVDCLALGLG
jgi:hypothetical protein